MRLQNFIATDKFIEEWNASGENTHTVGHNFFSDWTQFERDVFSGKQLSEDKIKKSTPSAVFELDLNASYPSAWTWQTGSNVGSVQTQGSCSSSYAFAAVGAVQSAMSIVYS